MSAPLRPHMPTRNETKVVRRKPMSYTTTQLQDAFSVAFNQSADYISPSVYAEYRDGSRAELSTSEDFKKLPALDKVKAVRAFNHYRDGSSHQIWIDQYGLGARLSAKELENSQATRTLETVEHIFENSDPRPKKVRTSIVPVGFAMLVSAALTILYLQLALPHTPGIVAKLLATIPFYALIAIASLAWGRHLHERPRQWLFSLNSDIAKPTSETIGNWIAVASMFLAPLLSYLILRLLP